MIALIKVTLGAVRVSARYAFREASRGGGGGGMISISLIFEHEITKHRGFDELSSSVDNFDFDAKCVRDVASSLHTL